MNRRQRRQAARHRDDAAQRFARGYTCPDCNPDTRLVQQAPGVFVMEIAHDNSCPAYRAMKKENQ